MGKFSLSRGTPGCVRVAGYGKYNPLDVSSSLLLLLPYFDESADTLADLERIRADQRIELETDLFMASC